MLLPTVPSLPAGHLVTATDMTNLAGCVTFLLTKPFSRVHTTTVQSVTTSAAAISWSTVDQDNDGMYAAGNPTRLTAVTPGWYKVRYAVVNTSTGNVVQTYVQETTGNGNPGGGGNHFGPFWPGDSQGSSGGSHGTGAAGLWPYYLYAGDYLEIFAYASASDPVDTGGLSFFSMEYIRMGVA